ncbi:MAG: GNAT family N-acetyltransferase [Candidatus Eisenbacteria bacterium]
MKIPRPRKKPLLSDRLKRKIEPALHLSIKPRRPPAGAKESPRLSFHPLTPSRWKDFVELFGPHGAAGGCWCMWWRLSAKEFNAGKGAPNRRAMKALVDAGRVPGILAYRDGLPVGWCAIAPRDEFPRLDRSRVLGRVDDVPVWSVVCFFIAREHRRTGVASELLKAAVAHARKQGAKVIEGYPIEPRTDSFPDVFAFHGTVSTFKQAGFQEVVRRSETRPIMRLRTRR